MVVLFLMKDRLPTILAIESVTQTARFIGPGQTVKKRVLTPFPRSLHAP
jgi:hypothetical protein